MAAQDAAQGKPEAFQRAVFAEGLQGVLGAGRGEAACGWLQRRDADLVKTDEKYERGHDDLLEHRLDLR